MEKRIMKYEGKEKKKLSRRDFIKTTAAAGVGAGILSGIDAKDARARDHSPVDQWDLEADIVVVGYGGAGAVAAITAHDAGARVLVLEKAPIEGGGSTRMAGGQAAYIDKKDAAAAAEYLFTGCLGTTPMDVCRAWAEEIAGNDAWLTQMGIGWMDMRLRPGFKNFADFQNFPGADALKLLAVKGGGPAFYKTVDQHIKNRKIEVLFGHPGTDLIQNPSTKEVIGVKAKPDGEEKHINIKALKAVILSTGGFEFNEKMKNNYLSPHPIKFVGWKYNTGDGIRMAQAIGADLWHMNVISSAGETILTPESEIGWMYPEAKGDSFIWVNRYGERFACESPSWFAHRASMGFNIWDWSGTQRDAGYPCIPFYLIFDEKTRLAGGVGNFSSQMGVLSIPEALGGISQQWSADNGREVELGWVKKGDTIRDLASAIGGTIDPSRLEASVSRWNQFCAAGRDEDFERSEKLAAIESPPFYGIEMYPGGFSTCGGPVKNGKAQVLDTRGIPVPRLYIAGELGSTAGHIYSMAGHNWAEFLAFGRIAGRNAAAETPLTNESF